MHIVINFILLFLSYSSVEQFFVLMDLLKIVTTHNNQRRHLEFKFTDHSGLSLTITEGILFQSLCSSLPPLTSLYLICVGQSSPVDEESRFVTSRITTF